MKLFTRSVFLLLISSFVAGQAWSEEKKPTPEEKAFKFRTSLFQTFAWKYGQLVGSKIQNDEAAFTKHANDLVNLTSLLEEGFAIENSLPEGTAAKPEIWQDYDTFKDKAQNLNAEAKELTVSGAMADFDARKFGSKACGSCHRDFRIKDE